MNLYKSFALVLALFALACNLSTTFAAETPKKSNNQPALATEPMVKKAIPVVKKVEPVKSAAPAKITKTETRYRATPEFVSVEKAGFTQPKYSGPASLDGLGLKSAKELGYDGKGIYNEYGNSARVVILSPLAMVYYDTGSLEPMYLAGCMINGKPSANRIKLLEPLQKAPEPKPVPLATPAPTPVVTSIPEPKVVPVVEVQNEKPAPVVQKVTSHYVPTFYSANGRVAVVPATRLLTRAAVVDIPIPTLTANGRPLDGQPMNGNPNQGNTQRRPQGRP